MLLEKSVWTTLEAYVPRRPRHWQLLLARAEWAWLEWRAGAKRRRVAQDEARLRAAARSMPAYLRRDIGLL